MNSSKLKAIKHLVCFYSGLKFQNLVGVILKEYYKNKGLDYINPNPAGGDDKNDGWVEKLGIYYQIYSPESYSSSFTSNTINKFLSDAEGLFDNVYNKKLWKAPINEFIFIVNTRDTGIPKDSSLACENKIKELNKKYASTTKYRFENFDYIEELLFDFSDSEFERLMVKLGIDDMYDYENITELSLLKFLDKLSYVCSSAAIEECKGSDYKRISSEDKIKLNNLESISGTINNIICKLYIVENAIAAYKSENPSSELIDKAINYVICKYLELKKNKKGTDLYYSIIDSITALSPDMSSFVVPAEMFVIYIFDRCDIFEKETV